MQVQLIPTSVVGELYSATWQLPDGSIRTVRHVPRRELDETHMWLRDEGAQRVDWAETVFYLDGTTKTYGRANETFGALGCNIDARHQS